MVDDKSAETTTIATSRDGCSNSVNTLNDFYLLIQ